MRARSTTIGYSTIQNAGRLALLLGSAVLLSWRCGQAEVVRIEIGSRESFADGHAFGRTGPYERLTGRLFLEVDPNAECNSQIVDLKLARRNERGCVEFQTDFFLLKPSDASRGNRRLFYDVNNRGNKLALGAFNNRIVRNPRADRGGNDPRTMDDAGNGFLMREGYSILWCGWNGDVRAGDNRLQIGLPIATDGEQPITGRVHAEICVNERTYSQPFYWGNSDPYPSVSLDNRDATLTMCPARSVHPVEVPRDQWSFARFENGEVIPDPRHLYLKGGFRAGWLYDLVYTARDPRVTGLGFAAVRDVVSFFRYALANEASRVNPLAGSIERAYVFGISQSARFIHHFIYQGFNGDESGRIVFDGAMAHVGGGGRGFFNHRFAQTTRHGSQHEDKLSPSEVFPFTTVPQEDPVTGERGDVLSFARQRSVVPKMFLTETSTEYWCRAASLLHTDVAGELDVGLDPQVRLYFIAGAQHGVSSSTERGIYRNPVNILDHRPVLRALLRAMDRWVTTDAEPPVSRYPHISDGTLVTFESYRKSAPEIPGLTLPNSQYVPLRLNFGPRFSGEGITDIVPPQVGPAFRTLVPAVDGDGNEISGIRLPEVAVPIATYAGWNVRSEAAGGEGALGRWSGSYLPFARTPQQQRKNGDPRLSVRERYPTREDFVGRVAGAALSLVAERVLLEEDLAVILHSAQTLWAED